MIDRWMWRREIRESRKTIEYNMILLYNFTHHHQSPAIIVVVEILGVEMLDAASS